MPKFKFNLLPKIAIDLGTSRTRIWVEGLGKVKDEASCLVVRQKDNKVLAVGDQALAYEKRFHQVIWPVRDGFVTDKQQVQALLKVMLADYWRPRLITQPIIAVSIPAMGSSLQKQTLSESLFEIGAREVVTVSQPLAAMFGVGVLANDPSGSLNLHLGAGVVEAALVSMGSVVQFASSNLAGEWLSWQLLAFLKKQFNLILSEQELQKVLTQLISVSSGIDQTMKLAGKNASTGQPISQTLTATQLLPLVKNYVSRYVDLVKQLLAKVSPELMDDSFGKGLLLTGGLAKLNGLERYLSLNLNMPVAMMEKPEDAVIEGLAHVLKHLEEFKNQAENQD